MGINVAYKSVCKSWIVPDTFARPVLILQQECIYPCCWLYCPVTLAHKINRKPFLSTTAWTKQVDFSTQPCSANVKLFFIADNVKLMMQSSLLGFRLSIVQLNDKNNDLNVNHIIQTMLLTTHNVCPVGVLFNYDCPHSKSFVSAVSGKNTKQRIRSIYCRIFVKVLQLCFSVHRADALANISSAWFSRRTLTRQQFNSFKWLRFTSMQKLLTSILPSTVNRLTKGAALAKTQQQMHTNWSLFIFFASLYQLLWASVWENIQFMIFTIMRSHTGADSM